MSSPTGIVVSDPSRGRNVGVLLFCVDRGAVKGSSPVQGALLNAYKIHISESLNSEWEHDRERIVQGRKKIPDYLRRNYN
jgi:hypothetical protein